MKKFRLGVVGLGHRGRGMFKGVAKGIGDFEAVAACDLNPALWFEPTNSYYGGTQPALAECMPDVAFFESYDDMIEKAGLDVVLVGDSGGLSSGILREGIEERASRFGYSDHSGRWRRRCSADMKDATGMLMTGATTSGGVEFCALQPLPARTSSAVFS
ncbi:MAG: hypothetical protein V8T87_03670 [Victivallales bacterium]